MMNSRIHRVEQVGHDADEQRDGQQVLPRRIRMQHQKMQHQAAVANPRRTKRN